MKKLLKNKKGFTLMEMLIVVAIIVILVAISVPTFTANLDQAKTTADAANYRAAKSAAQVYKINNDIETGTTYYYDAELGDISTEEPAGYGECSEHDAPASGEEAAYVEVVYNTDGTITCTWSHGSTTDCEPDAE